MDRELQEQLEGLFQMCQMRFAKPVKSGWMHGVLIAYLLCGKCATYIFKEAEKDPNAQTPLHNEIEKNLKQAYLRHQGH